MNLEQGIPKFGGGATQTVLNPVVLSIVIGVGILICVWPRARVIGVFLAASILIPTDQVLVIGPAHFPMMRVLLFFGIIRMLKDKLLRKYKLLANGLNKVDISVALLTLITAVNGIVLFEQSGAVIFQLGELYTVFGVYFFLRYL